MVDYVKIFHKPVDTIWSKELTADIDSMKVTTVSPTACTYSLSSVCDVSTVMNFGGCEVVDFGPRYYEKDKKKHDFWRSVTYYICYFGAYLGILRRKIK